MKYIIKFTHKNGVRLDRPLYYANSGSLHFEHSLQFVRLFDTETEAIRFAAEWVKSRFKMDKRTRYDTLIEAIAEDDVRIQPNIRPLF